MLGREIECSTLRNTRYIAMRLVQKAINVGIQHTIHVAMAIFLLFLLGCLVFSAYNHPLHSKFDLKRSIFGQQPWPVARNSCLSEEKLDIGSLTTVKADEERILLLLSLWEASPLLNTTISNISTTSNINLPEESIRNVPRPPHLEDCKSRSIQNELLDTREIDGRRPRWLPWKGRLGFDLGKKMVYENEDVGEEMLYNRIGTVEGPYPPWVEGADEDNLPMTRRVQRDIWLHQHPPNCSDPRIKFLFTKWDTGPNLGFGALLISMSGFLANALEAKRVLVTDHFERANHDGCLGSTNSQWSCYFLPETSKECRQQALRLSKQKEAWKDGVIVDARDFSSSQIWFSKIPEYWGRPWERMQPTIEIDNEILLNHNAMDRRWWRAQALRYFMRFPSEYTCNLLNEARHRTFGHEAAALVLKSVPSGWPQETKNVNDGPMEHFIWASQRPWIPRPLLNIHVRLGDKASEMKMIGFDGYMKLAERLQSHFPQVKNVWLSTEMQNVIDTSKLYSGWSFYYSNISRQTENISMQSYERGLGKKTSTNNAVVNLLMASDADYFIGALGSTWCILIDGLRCTGGKEMAGYLSVNKDRFW